MGGLYFCNLVALIDATNCLSNCKSHFVNLWRQTSFIVSAKIIFVHIQTIFVYAKGIQLLFLTLSFYSLSFSAVSQPVSNQMLEGDQMLDDYIDLQLEVNKSKIKYLSSNRIKDDE